MIVCDLTTESNLSIVSGDSVSRIANHAYTFSVNFYEDGATCSFDVVTIPTPGAPALLGLVRISVRKRRK